MYPMTSVVVIFLAVILFLNAGMYLQQPGMIFFPSHKLDATPSDWGLEYEDVQLDAGNGTRLHGWYLPHNASSQVLLFFHGNAGNISHRGDSIKIFHRLGLNVLIIDYRGYGQSQGKPSEQGLYQDAAAAWNYLTENRNYDAGNIILFGRSLGGAVAAQLATAVEPGGLILESTMSSAHDFAGYAFPGLSRVVVLRYEFNVSRFLQSVSCPVLVLHSPDDEIMPFFLGEKVYQSASEPKAFFELQGDHNSGFLQSQPAYEQALGNFIAAQL